MSERIISASTYFFVIFEVFITIFGDLTEDAKVVLGQNDVRWIELAEIYMARSWSGLESVMGQILFRNTQVLI